MVNPVGDRLRPLCSEGDVEAMRIRRRWFNIALTVASPGLVCAFLFAGGALGASNHSRPPMFHAHFPGHKILFPTRVAWGQGIRNQGYVGPASMGSPLVYQGGAADGIGVTTGTPAVYVVFWGSQWGNPVDTGGFTVGTLDPSGLGLRLEQMYAGLGSDGEQWSGVMSEYCQGIPAGSTVCPSGAPHVGLPGSSGVLAGVWVDNAAPAPATATDSQIAAAAVAAAGHFQNVTGALNRNAQYIVVSPTGTHPGGFDAGANFCAWHDWNGDTSLNGGPAPSPYGDIAFTNMPYVVDAGVNCGANYVNPGSAGVLDGVTLVAGHEYAETLTDQIPVGGWVDANGNETGDKCAWVGVGGTSGAQDVTFATGTFPMQATWSNLAGGCEIIENVLPTTTAAAPASTTTTSITTTSITTKSTTTTSTTTTSTVPIPSSTTTTSQPAGSIVIVNPGAQQLSVRIPFRLTLVVSDTAPARVLVRVLGLPRGLYEWGNSGRVFGAPHVPGTYEVTVFAFDTRHNSARTLFPMIVSSHSSFRRSHTVIKHTRSAKASKYEVLSHVVAVTLPVARR